MTVNNNASALLLCLSALSRGKKVAVSRGELVEIGGSFRVPDIMKESGATLVEVGTTNKTRLSDYRGALEKCGGQPDTSPAFGALLKVHTSNYRIIGFSEDTSLEELSLLGRENGLPLVYDLGSGLMTDLRRFGVDEPTVSDSLKSGADLVLFSGDKLLGGPQAGIIVGKKELVERMKRHPLARVVRIDKMTLAALEETFRAYLDPEQALGELPVLSMITQQEEDLHRKAQHLALLIQKQTDRCDVDVQPALDFIGGGSAPELELKGAAVVLSTSAPDRFEEALRKGETPLIVRIFKDRVWIHVRTLAEDELPEAAKALADALTRCAGKGGSSGE